jgi:hypothetical protein
MKKFANKQLMNKTRFEIVLQNKELHIFIEIG